MRYAYHASMCPPEQYIPLAQALEIAGFDAFAMPDSICYPEVSDSQYPYNKDGDREFLDSVPFIHPFIVIPAMAAVTRKIRFNTFVYKLGVHQPVHVAKQIQSLAIMTNNRFDFGVGISPWPEDFAITSTPWEGRGKRLDEIIDIIGGLETGKYFEFEGEHFKIQSVKMCPAPTEHVPILIGGHAEPALRRAAVRSDGWMCAGANMAELDGYIRRINELREEAGTAEKPFQFHTTGGNRAAGKYRRHRGDHRVSQCL